MPEGHTIHALARRLERALGGNVITATSPQGRFAADAARLDQHMLDRAEAVGKHLFVEIGPHVLHVHLGLIGTFHVKLLASMPLGEPAPTVRLRLVGDAYGAELRGPMICALIDDEWRAAIEARLGPDPLDPFAEPDRAWQRIRKSRKAIGDLVMDQTVVAGVGNVYRCEILHRLGIDPLSPGKELHPQVWQSIWEDLVMLMPLGMVFSQILTMQDQVEEAQAMMADGSVRAVTERQTGERLGGYFERRFHVYQRSGEPCRRCGNSLQDRKIGGRTLYWCPACQIRH